MPRKTVFDPERAFEAAEQGFRSQDQPDEEGNCHADNRIMDEFASHRYWCYRFAQ
jgi:hypothetical protein